MERDAPTFSPPNLTMRQAHFRKAARTNRVCVCRKWLKCSIPPCVCFVLAETTFTHARFHLVPYSVRVWASTVLLVLSLVTVGYGGSTTVQLLGVCFSSLQGGLGESSFLALASFYDTPRALTAWSSGTGFAGIFGYGWVFFLRFMLGLSFRATLMAANLLGLVFLYAYFLLLTAPHSYMRSSVQQEYGGNGARGTGAADSPLSSSRRQLQASSLPSPSLSANSGQARLYSSTSGEGVREEEEEEEGWEGAGERWADVGVTAVESRHAPDMTVGERLRFTLSLWRFTVPLMLVYFAEVRALMHMNGSVVFAVHDSPADLLSDLALCRDATCIWEMF